jgi:hypothetical protein
LIYEPEYSFILLFLKKVLIKTNAIQILYILCKCITVEQLYINYKILLNIYNKNQIHKIKKSNNAFFK